MGIESSRAHAYIRNALPRRATMTCQRDTIEHCDIEHHVARYHDSHSHFTQLHAFRRERARRCRRRPLEDVRERYCTWATR